MTSFHLCICVKKQHIHINTLAINLAKPSCISEIKLIMGNNKGYHFLSTWCKPGTYKAMYIAIL